MFNVAIVGADGLNNYDYCMSKTIKILSRKAKEKEGIMILSTGEDFVKKFSTKFNIDTQTYFTDFKKYGKNALKMRNIELLDNCNAIIIFNDGKKDTSVLKDMAMSRNIPLRYIA